MRQTLAGIPLRGWQEFFKPFADTASEASLRAAIKTVATKLAAQKAPGAQSVAQLAEDLQTLAMRIAGVEK